MVAEAKEVAPNTYRESYGRYFEDFTPGDIYEHRPGRTITEVDNTWFTLLTMNTHPIHFDAEYAKASEFKKPLVNSCLTLSIVAGMHMSIYVGCCVCVPYGGINVGRSCVVCISVYVSLPALSVSACRIRCRYHDMGAPS